MRCRVAVLLLTVLLAPAGLRLCAAFEDTEAQRCAIACGHAAVAAGASCCPMSGAAGGDLAFQSCARGNGAGAPLTAGQAMLLISAAATPRLDADDRVHSGASPRLHPAFSRGLDHVPLLRG